MRSLIDWLHAQWTPLREQQWRAERFSFAPRPDCQSRDLRDLGAFGLDFMLFVKVYAHREFGELAYPLFKAVAASGQRRGSSLVQILAEAMPEENLRLRLQMNDLPAALQHVCEDLEMKSGWRHLGFAVSASADFREQFKEASSSYAGHWLVSRLRGGEWDGDSTGLVAEVNGAWHEARSEVGEWQALDRMIKGKLLDLPGSACDSLNSFFRDWGDFDGWRFGWKHDSANKDFWKWVAKCRPDLLRSGSRRAVLEALRAVLTEDEVASGQVARLNSIVYRIVGGGPDDPEPQFSNFEEFAAMARKEFRWR